MQTQLIRCLTPRRRSHVERFVVGAQVIAFALASCRLACAHSVRVAVIHSVGQDEEARRLCAEVSAAGLDAVDVSVSSAEPRSTAEITRAVRALSALRIQNNGALELVVIDADTGNLLEQAVLAKQEPQRQLDLRAVEDLRAKLVAFSTVLPATGAGTPALADATSDHRRSAPPRAATSGDSAPAVLPTKRGLAIAHEELRSAKGIWLQAAAGGALGSGGLGANAVSSLGIRFEPSERWSVSGRIMLPLSAQEVVNQRGMATVDVSLFGATLGAVPIRLQSFDLELALGGAAVRAAMRGIPAGLADVGRSRTVWASALFVDVSLAWRVSSWFRLRAAGLGGVAAPRPTVGFDGELAAGWGRPLAMATLGVELEPFRAAEGTR